MWPVEGNCENYGTVDQVCVLKNPGLNNNIFQTNVHVHVETVPFYCMYVSLEDDVLQWNPSIAATLGERHYGRYTGVVFVEGFWVLSVQISIIITMMHEQLKKRSSILVCTEHLTVD